MYNYRAIFFKYFVLALVVIPIVSTTPTYAIEALSDNELQNNFTSLQNFKKKQKIKSCDINKIQEHHKKYKCKLKKLHQTTNYSQKASNYKKKHTQSRHINSVNTHLSNNELNTISENSTNILTQLHDDSDLSRLGIEIIPTATDSSHIKSEWNDEDINSDKLPLMPMTNSKGVLRSVMSNTNPSNNIKISKTSGYFYRSVYGGINNGMDIEIPSIMSNKTEILIKRSD